MAAQASAQVSWSNPTSKDMSWFPAEMDTAVSCDQASPELSNHKLPLSGNGHYSLLPTPSTDLWKWSVLPDIEKYARKTISYVLSRDKSTIANNPAQQCQLARRVCVDPPMATPYGYCLSVPDSPSLVPWWECPYSGCGLRTSHWFRTFCIHDCFEHTWLMWKRTSGLISYKSSLVGAHQHHST